MAINFLPAPTESKRERSAWIGVPDGYKRRMKMAELLAKQGADTTAPVYSIGHGLTKLASGALAGMMMGYEERQESEAQAAAQKISSDAMMKAAGFNPDGSAWTPSPTAAPATSATPQATTTPGMQHGGDGSTYAAMFKEKETEYGLPEGYLDNTARIESNYTANAANPKSSAKGLFQFIDDTAQRMKLTDPNDPAASTDAAAQLAASNRLVLSMGLKRDPTPVELYLAHQQGPNGALKILRNLDSPMEQLVGHDAAVNNGAAGMTGRQFLDSVTKKYSGGSGQPPIGPQAGPAPFPETTSELGYRSDAVQRGPQLASIDPHAQITVPNASAASGVQPQVPIAPMPGGMPVALPSTTPSQPSMPGAGDASPTVENSQGPVPRNALVQALMERSGQNAPQQMFDLQAMTQGMGYTPNALTNERTATIARMLAQQSPPREPPSPGALQLAAALNNGGRQSAQGVQVTQATLPDQPQISGQRPMNIAPQQLPMGSIAAAPTLGMPPQAALPQRPQFSPQEAQAIFNNPRIAPEVKQQVLKSMSPEMEVIQGKDGGLYAYDKRRPGQPVKIGQMPSERYEDVKDASGNVIGQRNVINNKTERYAPTDTSDIREYNYYTNQARRAGQQPEDFTTWMRNNKKAGATTVDASTKFESEESKVRGAGLAKRLNEVAESGAKAAEDDITLQRLGHLVANVKTGGRTNVLEGIRQLTGGVVSLDPKADDVQALVAGINYLAPRLRVPGSGSQSDRELNNFLISIPSLAGTPEGNQKIMQTLQGIVDHRRRAAEIATMYQVGEISGKEATSQINALPSPFAPKPSARGVHAAPPQAVEALRADPSLRQQFDEKYGPGASDRALGGR